MIRIINREALDLGECGIGEKGDAWDGLGKEVKIPFLSGNKRRKG